VCFLCALATWFLSNCFTKKIAIFLFPKKLSNFFNKRFLKSIFFYVTNNSLKEEYFLK